MSEPRPKPIFKEGDHVIVRFPGFKGVIMSWDPRDEFGVVLDPDAPYSTEAFAPGSVVCSVAVQGFDTPFLEVQDALVLTTSQMIIDNTEERDEPSAE